MGNDVAKKPENELCNLDGFDGFTDETEGEDEQSSRSLIVGTKIKFDEAQVWVDSNGKKLPAGLELVFIKVRRVVRKWGPDNKSIEGETKILEPHEKWPDFDALNAKCPKSQWHEAFGKIRGPYRGQRLVYLVDQQTMAPYTWPSPKDTIGSRICVTDIVDRTNWMRRFKSALVYPVVELSDTFMRTSYGGARGGRQRPHFIVKRWIALGSDGQAQELESPMQKMLDDFGNKQNSAKTVTSLLAKEVTPPTAKEVTGDEIPF